MSDFEEKLHEVEINFPKQVGGPSDFFIKIDGVPFEPTCGVKVESAMVNNSVYPIITISFMAKNVKGSIEGKVIKEIKNE